MSRASPRPRSGELSKAVMVMVIAVRDNGSNARFPAMAASRNSPHPAVARGTGARLARSAGKGEWPMSNLVGALIGAAIDRRDGDSGIKGAILGAATEGALRIALPIALTYAIG